MNFLAFSKSSIIAVIIYIAIAAITVAVCFYLLSLKDKERYEGELAKKKSEEQKEEDIIEEEPKSEQEDLENFDWSNLE